MNKNTLVRKPVTSLVALIALVAVSIGATGAMAAPPAQAGPLETVQAFRNAYASGDIATLRALIAPGTQFVNDIGGGPQTQSFDEFIAPPRPNLTVDSMTQTGPDTVVVQVTASGGGLPALPHPFTGTGTFTVRDGKITGYTLIASPQTMQDVRASMANSSGPGMPTTGQSQWPVLWVVVAFGVVCLIGLGTLFRRWAAH